MSASPLGGGWDVDFVARNARDAPDAPACCEVGDDGAVGTRLSWRELDERVDAASRAIGACTPPGRRVICVARDGIAPLVALHACYRAGRSFVATDHASWPATRLAAIAADALCASAVCADDDESTRARGWFGDAIDAYVSLESVDARDDTAVSAPSAPSASVGDPRWRELYVAYTSGSSGFGAKGTVATVDAVFRYCASKTRVESIDSTAACVPGVQHHVRHIPKRRVRRSGREVVRGCFVEGVDASGLSRACSAMGTSRTCAARRRCSRSRICRTGGMTCRRCDA
jgi:acyl-coenzyme A synthetase/AMP-(fatty) acid ligase